MGEKAFGELFKQTFIDYKEKFISFFKSYLVIYLIPVIILLLIVFLLLIGLITPQLTGMAVNNIALSPENEINLNQTPASSLSTSVIVSLIIIGIIAFILYLFISSLLYVSYIFISLSQNKQKIREIFKNSLKYLIRKIPI